MLNVTRLRILTEVAYRGSLSAAATELSYTQSAVSQQIAALEAEAGIVLLERHPRGVSLTAAGQTLVNHAEGILGRLEAADAALAAIKGLRRGPPAGRLLPDRGRHPDAARDRPLPRLLPGRRADADRG